MHVTCSLHCKAVGLCMILGCEMRTVRRCMRFEHEIKPRVAIHERRNRGWHYDEYDGTPGWQYEYQGGKRRRGAPTESAICERNQIEMVVRSSTKGRQTSTNSGVPVNEIKPRRQCKYQGGKRGRGEQLSQRRDRWTSRFISGCTHCKCKQGQK